MIWSYYTSLTHVAANTAQLKGESDNQISDMRPIALQNVFAGWSYTALSDIIHRKSPTDEKRLPWFSIWLMLIPVMLREFPHALTTERG